MVIAKQLPSIKKLISKLTASHKRAGLNNDWNTMEKIMKRYGEI